VQPGDDVAGFDATPVDLQLCGSNLTEISNGLTAELNNLRSEMDGLFAAGWQGEAASGFAQGWDQWQSGARDVLDALRDMAELLTSTGRNYQSTDDSAAGDLGESGAGV
jgi:WXG100 family type VII secretion target